MGESSGTDDAQPRPIQPAAVDPTAVRTTSDKVEDIAKHLSLTKVDKGLYVSGIRAASQPNLVKEAGTTHVVSLGRKIPDDKRVTDTAIKYLYFYIDIDDNGSELWAGIADRNGKGKLLIEFIETENLADPNNCVLVHCAQGLCRSVLVALFILTVYKGETVLKALNKIKAALPKAELFKSRKAALLSLKPPSPDDLKRIEAMSQPHYFMNPPKEEQPFYAMDLLNFKGYPL